jgi:hypothetical protein
LAGVTVFWGRQDLKRALAAVALSGVLAGLPLLLSFQNFMSGSGWLNLSTQIGPLRTWTGYTDNWFLDLVASWAFPISVIAVLIVGGNLNRSRLNWLLPSWLLALGSTFLFALLIEVSADGTTGYSGNFAWGAMSATAGLYVTSAISLRGLKMRFTLIPLIVLAAQAYAGLVYLNGYIESGSFL